MIESMRDYIDRSEKQPEGELIFTHDVTRDGLVEVTEFDRNSGDFDHVKSLGSYLYLAWDDDDTAMYVYVGKYE